MKTKLCRPVLVDCDELPFVGDLCTSPRYENKLLIFGNFENSYQNECQKKQLVLVSLDPDEKIDISDYVFEHYEIRLFNSKRNPNKTFKVIATQSQLSPEYMNRFIEEYNKGTVKDVEIEMEKTRVLSDAGIDNGYGDCIYDTVYKPKLTNGFVTIIGKEKSDREKAIAWWNKLDGLTQRSLFLQAYNPFERSQNSLTGWEIEQLWRKEVQPKKPVYQQIIDTVGGEEKFCELTNIKRPQVNFEILNNTTKEVIILMQESLISDDDIQNFKLFFNRLSESSTFAHKAHKELNKLNK